MTKRATAESLRKPRETTVELLVDGERTEFVVAKMKEGQRRRLYAEAVDAYGNYDQHAAARLVAEMCCVDPALTAEDVDEMDSDIVVPLAEAIASHSNLSNLQSAATPDPEEGSEELKSFPAPGGSTGVGSGVDAAPDRA